MQVESDASVGSPRLSKTRHTTALFAFPMDIIRFFGYSTHYSTSCIDAILLNDRINLSQSDAKDFMLFFAPIGNLTQTDSFITQIHKVTLHTLSTCCVRN